MAQKYLEAHPCQDRCGMQKTGETHDGHRVYRCPGCDSRWYDTEDSPRTRGDIRESLRQRLLGRD